MPPAAVAGMRMTWCLLAFLLGCEAPELTDPEAPPPADDPVASPELARLPPGVCLPRLCGVEGTTEACGLQDDGCGGVQWCGSCACGSNFRTCELDVPVISEAVTTLSPGVPIVITTSNLSAGADSVLHLLDATTGAQLAMNDNQSGTLASRINYVWNTTRQVRIVVRAKSAATVGTATLNYAGTSAAVGLAFPERLVLSPRAGERLQTVRMPGGADARHVVYQLSGQNIIARHRGTSVDWAISVPLAAASGTQHFLFGRTGLAPGSVPGRLVRNDAALAGHDPDVDGLGTELEAALGTCSSLSGTATGKDGATFACNQAADARDTDGDALPDGWEVLEHRVEPPRLPLVLWGANPRHKDLFVEVDWGQSTPGQADVLMTRAETMDLAKHFEDRIRTLSAGARAAHAASIANPDGKVGIELHVDNGLAPVSPRDVTTYGDWGGHSIVPPVLDEQGAWQVAALGDWETRMSARRRGIFKNGLKLGSGAGKGQLGGVAFMFGPNGVALIAHELAHTVGLGHSGPPYAEGADVNCKPNYSSLMNYAFLYRGASFSDGTNSITLNNAWLPEWQAADPSTQAMFLDVLEDEFWLRVDRESGHIDWNRDGHYAKPGETVRAYANYRVGSSCEYPRVNQSKAVASFDTTLSPALGRVQGRTLVLHALPGSIGWAGTTGTLDCTTPQDTPCDEFSLEGKIAMDATGGVDAVHLVADDALLIVARGEDHRLRWTRLLGWWGTTPLYTGPQLIDGPLAAGEPALALGANGVATLVYRDAAGQLYLSTFDAAPAGSWSAAEAQLLTTGEPLVMGTVASPGIGLAPLPQPGRAVEPLLYGVFARPEGNDDELVLYFREPADGRWATSTILNDYASNPPLVTGRPALEWVEDPLNLELGGRLYVMFTGAGSADPDKRILTQLWSHVDRNSLGLPRVRFGLGSRLDNVWAYGYGVDLLFEPGVDTNLRAAWTNSFAFDEGNGTIGGQVRFLPNADGITDLDYVDYDDWKTMRVGLCKHHASMNGTITDLACPPPTW